jgi:thymidylate synthase
MRSNDVIFGYRNDYAWQREVQLRLVEDLNAARDRMFEEPIDVGTMVWQVQNLHVYERHFDLVE